MNSNILIVGGSSGLGRQLAILYATAGHGVGIIGRRESLLQEVKQQFPNQIHTLTADIDSNDIGEKLITLIDAMGGTDLVIVAASVVEFNYELNDAPEMKTIGINVKGYVKVLNTAWHYFKQKGSGHITGVTSIAAARGNKKAPAYHASKAFQSIYLESLRVKAKHEKNNITITELVPGYIDTGMAKGDRLFWMVSADKAAHLCVRAIRKKKARAFIPGKWWFMYHVQRLFPIALYDRLINGRWKLKQKP